MTWSIFWYRIGFAYAVVVAHAQESAGSAEIRTDRGCTDLLCGTFCRLP